MRRTAIFLTNDPNRLLQEAPRRTCRPQAEIVRDALAQCLRAQERPSPLSVGMGKNDDRSVTSNNVKEWVRDRWRQDLEVTEEGERVPPTC